MADNDFDDDDLVSGLYLFGCNLLEIRCMRSSLMSAYVGGIVGVIAGIWWRNNFRIAMHAGLGGFCSFASFSWIKCRYQSSETTTGLKGVASQRMKMVGGDQYILPHGLLKMRKLDNIKSLAEWENESV